jgi:hypothetical protein
VRALKHFAGDCQFVVVEFASIDEFELQFDEPGRDEVHRHRLGGRRRPARAGVPVCPEVRQQLSELCRSALGHLITAFSNFPRASFGSPELRGHVEY